MKKMFLLLCAAVFGVSVLAQQAYNVRAPFDPATVKMAEDGSGDIIVRLYESKKAAVSTKLNVALAKKFKASACDMLENVKTSLKVKDGAIDLTFRAFEIKTVRISVK